MWKPLNRGGVGIMSMNMSHRGTFHQFHSQIADHVEFYCWGFSTVPNLWLQLRLCVVWFTGVMVWSILGRLLLPWRCIRRYTNVWALSFKISENMPWILSATHLNSRDVQMWNYIRCLETSWQHAGVKALEWGRGRMLSFNNSLEECYHVWVDHVGIEK